jgi:hypothetical protein
MREDADALAVEALEPMSRRRYSPQGLGVAPPLPTRPVVLTGAGMGT